jgi:hypothetical protein
VKALTLGRPMIHPLVDGLLVAGGLTFVVLALVAVGAAPKAIGGGSWVFVVFGANLTHFAASTVRLYTKRGATTDWPFVAFALPLLTLILLLLALVFADHLGWHLVSLYLTWSAYHYAAQTYGISMIYAYRSQRAPQDGDRRYLRAACLLPFLYLFFKGPEAGLEWLIPLVWLTRPEVAAVRGVLVQFLGVASLIAPFLVLAWSWRRGRALPLLSVLAMLANATWWTTRDIRIGMAWIALFHGLQYIPIVTAFHVKERLAEPGNTRGVLYHAAWFYAACAGLAYLLFQAWPYAFVAAGFGMAESALLVVATINIHHFIVDAYIWRLRKDPNYQVVTGTLPPPAVDGAAAAIA